MKSNREKAFRAVYPSAIIESHKTHGGRHYYLVRKTRRAIMYSGSGSTRIAAWRDATLALPIEAATPTIEAVTPTN
jgi:hypothetical protein